MSDRRPLVLVPRPPAPGESAPPSLADSPVTSFIARCSSTAPGPLLRTSLSLALFICSLRTEQSINRPYHRPSLVFSSRLQHVNSIASLPPHPGPSLEHLPSTCKPSSAWLSPARQPREGASTPCSGNETKTPPQCPDHLAPITITAATALATTATTRRPQRLQTAPQPCHPRREVSLTFTRASPLLVRCKGSPTIFDDLSPYNRQRSQTRCRHQTPPLYPQP